MMPLPKLFNFRAILWPKPMRPSASASEPANDKSKPKPKPKKSAPSATSIPLPTPRRKRPRLSTTPQTSNPSPLIRRLPSLLSANEEYHDAALTHRESTPRSKRLRRTSELSTNLIGTTTTTLPPTPADSSPAPAPADTSTSFIPPEDEAAELDDLITNHSFSQQEALLFLRIQHRGFEALMPAHWQVDFNTMPDNLFFPAAENAVGHIDSITLSGTFNATCAFQNVVNMGALVRGKMEAKKGCEERVVQACRKYIQWSVEDVRVNLKGHPVITPRICLIGSQGGGARTCEERMQVRLRQLAEEVREEEQWLEGLGYSRGEEASRTVYGVAVSGCVVALVTLDARREDAECKTMSLLDFSDRTLDFWNAVSLALVVIAAREDELERNEWYEKEDVKRSPLEMGVRGKRVRKGWEIRCKEVIDDDVDR